MAGKPHPFGTKGLREWPGGGSWYRGDGARFNPTKEQMAPKGKLVKWIFDGWLPKTPVISKTDLITTFGSCFATHVSDYLSKRGYNVSSRLKWRQTPFVIAYSAGLNNVAVIRQQFEWALEGRKFGEVLWHDKQVRPVVPDERIRQRTAELFNKTEVFILTLGLSEIWENQQTGEVFWRAIPSSQFRPGVHGFRVLSVKETKTHLEKIISLIREHRGPGARIIFTISPVPLRATFRPVSCMTASCVSKSILRVAVDEVYRGREDPHIYYFPSFEVVQQMWGRAAYLPDNRHIKPRQVRTLMKIFERYYCEGGA